MQYSGTIKKMQTSLIEGNATYHLPIDDEIVAMNTLVGNEINLSYSGNINCLHCGKITKKSYSQGHCYQCSQTLACCDLCIMRPETCHHHLGTCREPLWGLDNCFTSHVVYVANSSAVKVGITRRVNIPSRFIDQGAVEFLPILEVDTRLKAGKIEHFLKSFIADKTNWRTMLKGEVIKSDLMDVRASLLAKVAKISEELGANIMQTQVQNISYSVMEYPTKITSLSFDTSPVISGVLRGIKGQYLLFDMGVINIRKFGGYNIKLEI